ncbi:M10 family metallopeptidase C-terminal domain-containing protein [Marinibacterium sp. SX1]|uniref:M10 family metallopeptidase C-terminal domain-containing protein n=1 Tax=Marinibacterium sp. SX1 TaxID=3388424 RepID=UPI003D16CD09
MTAVTETGQSGEVFDPWLWDQKWDVQTLTYSFPTDGSYYTYQPDFRVTELTESQKDAVRRALDDIASFTGLDFQEVTETQSTEADMRFAQENNLGGAYAYLPTTASQGGDAFFGSGTENPVIGNEAYVYFIHEIGHAMGLEHGHEYPEFVASGYDSQEYTVVTYTDYVGDTDTFSYDSGLVDWAQSYQQLDIAALQFMYGANFSATGEVWSGDTVYMFDPDTGEMSINGVGQGTPAGNRIFRTIWDGHGEDTYDLSNYDTDLAIDLRPGQFSTFSEAQLADLDRNSDDPSRIAAGNVANARLYQGDLRSLIENAIGGDGDDKMLGNDGANALIGGRGHDGLFGGFGDDILSGANGNDTLKGADGNDVLRGQNGADFMVGGAGDDILIGGEGYDRMYGQAGADTFRFWSVDDSLNGTRLDRVQDFTSGDDLIDLARISDGSLQLSIGGGFSEGLAMAITRENKGNTAVMVDADGDGQAEMKFFLIGTLDVTENDFLL